MAAHKKPRKELAARAINIGISAALLGAAIILVAQLVTPAEKTRLIIQREPTGPRIWYPADRLPRLVLPDGRHETVKSVLNITRPMHFGDYVWNERQVPKGRMWVRIDLGTQTLSVFRAGHEIGSAVILYGTDGKPTPTGIFPILSKARDYRSRQYDAPMPYTLRLTQDGVAIHGSNVREGFGTHGCIGIPTAFAGLLYDQLQRGDLVAILPATAATGPHS